MDKRKFNGGNSTKAKGVDKRKNEFKEALEKAGSVDKIVDVLDMLYDKSTKDKDTKAASIYLAYFLGKPKETKEISINEDLPIIDL